MKPYSNDIRTRIIEFHKLGMRQIKIAERLKIHKSTVSRIIKLSYSTSSCNPKIPITTRPRSLDYYQVVKYIDENPDKTQSEIGAIFGIKNIWYIVKKMNYSYKKTLLVTGEKGRFEKKSF